MGAWRAPDLTRVCVAAGQRPERRRIVFPITMRALRCRSGVKELRLDAPEAIRQRLRVICGRNPLLSESLLIRSGQSGVQSQRCG